MFVPENMNGFYLLNVTAHFKISTGLWPDQLSKHREKTKERFPVEESGGLV
jgi:hypothetical protein